MFRSLAVAALSLSLGACIVVNDGGEAGFVVPLQLKFAGGGCSSAHVDSVRFTFPGGEAGSTTAECTSGDAPFVTQIAVNRSGTFNLQIDAFDGASLAYTGTFTVTTDGTNFVDLQGATELVINFAFAGAGSIPGLTCAEAGVTTVKISAGDVAWDEQPCINAGRDAVALGINPGSYDFTIDAYGADHTKLYGGVVTSQAINLGSNEVTFNLPALVKGGLEFVWSTNPSANCGDNYTVEYALKNAAGQAMSDDPKIVSCQDGGQRLENIAAGRYQLIYIRTRDFQGNILRNLTGQNLFAPAGRTQSFTLSLL